MEKIIAGWNRTGSGLSTTAPWMAHRSSRLRAYGARFDERKSPGERGEGGELTRTENNEREATEGGVALGEMAMALQAHSGARVGCIGLE